MYISNDKEKIREFSDLRRLQLPTRLEISNFRSDVDAPTSTNSISPNLGECQPLRQKYFSYFRTACEHNNFSMPMAVMLPTVEQLKGSRDHGSPTAVFFQYPRQCKFYLVYTDFCQYLFAKNRPRFITKIFLLLLLELSVRRFA